MTAVAARLLDEFEKLAPEEQLLVRERVISLTESVQHKAIQYLRGASQGKGLLFKLLIERAGERERGWGHRPRYFALADNEAGADRRQASIVKQIMLPPK